MDQSESKLFINLSNMVPLTKRKYNLTYLAKKKGLLIDGHRHQIRLRFDEIQKLVRVKEAICLITDYNFTLLEDRQLKLNF
jgi:hypothetical protein